MSVNLRFPNITAVSDAEKLQQMQSYIHQLVEQLNWALTNVDKEAVQAEQATSTVSNASSGDGTNGTDAQTNFNSIKALIIKSADIINAYYEEINKRIEGEYVSESDFGTYKEETSADISLNSKNISTIFEDIQSIITDIEGLENSTIAANAYINAGLLGYDDLGVPVYGLEIGQRTEVDGEEVFNKYARFTSEKLSFYDQNDNEVAYISDKTLHITYVEVAVSFSIGGFVDTVLADGSVVTKYIVNGGNR